jgi:hypothetical protein
MAAMRTVETVLRWSGRLAAVATFLLWGAFFVEHMQEWFLRSDGQLPPPRVWVGQGLHLAMLVALLAMLKWERRGAVLTVLATAAFFGSIGMRTFPWFALINMVPVALLAAAWWAGRQEADGLRPRSQE